MCNAYFRLAYSRLRDCVLLKQIVSRRYSRDNREIEDNFPMYVSERVKGYIEAASPDPEQPLLESGEEVVKQQKLGSPGNKVRMTCCYNPILLPVQHYVCAQLPL
jgi:hypothetical protein